MELFIQIIFRLAYLGAVGLAAFLIGIFTFTRHGGSTLFRAALASIYLLTFVPASANADGWAVLSQQEQMKNYVIADVGEVSKVEPPFNTKWENDVYQMNNRCFSFSGYLGHWGYGSKAALLLVNAQKTIQLALVEPAIGSTKVELKSITMLECPSVSNITPYSDDPEERLRLLKKRQDELKRKLEEIQRQR